MEIQLCRESKQENSQGDLNPRFKTKLKTKRELSNPNAPSWSQPPHKYENDALYRLYKMEMKMKLKTNYN